MDNLGSSLMGIILAVLFGWFCGWMHAHSTISTECENVEGFYVGSKVYECVIKGSKQEGAKE